MSDVSEESVRSEVRAWLAANWTPDLGLVEWRNKLIDSMRRRGRRGGSLRKTKRRQTTEGRKTQRE